jgi:hypothetical protein
MRKLIVTIPLLSLLSMAPSAQAPSAGSWTPPRTSWGDPDLQGNFTNLWEVGTPFERPDEFAGRQLADISAEELANIRQGIQDQTRKQQLAGEIGGTRWIWLDSHNHTKGSMAWFVVDPQDGRIPPMTPEGQQRAAARAAARQNSGRGPADSYEDRSLFDRCISRGLPGSMMPAIYGNSYQIVQTPGYVAIRYEMIHETRIIPLDNRPRVGKVLRPYMGDGRGRWEGNTLVVETTNFPANISYRGANPDSLRIVERFTRTAPEKVKWEVTIDDPSTWTKPWTFAMPLTIDDQEPLFEYACHEGNYAISNILSGARAEEKRVDDARRQGISVAPRPIPTGDESER